jgi:hypothetical protein
VDATSNRHDNLIAKHANSFNVQHPRVNWLSIVAACGECCECLLTGPRTFSSAAGFADVVKTYHLATILGEEKSGS